MASPRDAMACLTSCEGRRTGNGVRHHHASHAEARPHAGGRPGTVSPTKAELNRWSV